MAAREVDDAQYVEPPLSGRLTEMARGWESKAVEAQQDAAADRREPVAVTAEDPVRKAQRATLMLARTRAMADLQLACAAAHRAMLEQAIADLDQRLAALDPRAPAAGE